MTKGSVVAVDIFSKSRTAINFPPVQLPLISVLVVTHFEPQIPNGVQNTVPRGPSGRERVFNSSTLGVVNFSHSIPHGSVPSDVFI